jgi:hypothetical protein
MIAKTLNIQRPTSRKRDDHGRRTERLTTDYTNSTDSKIDEAESGKAGKRKLGERTTDHGTKDD